MSHQQKQAKHVHMLNERQLAWMIITILISGGLMSLPRTLIQIARLDAWFAQVGGLLFAMFVAFFFFQCARKFPRKNLFEVTFELCGRYVGGAINAVFIGYIWMSLIRDIREFADFINSTLLMKTPLEFTILLLVMVMVYYCKSSVEVVARVNDLMIPVFLLVQFALPLLLTNEFSTTRLEPILGNGIVNVLEGNVLSIGCYGDLLVVGAFLHTLTTSRQVHTALKHGIVAAAFGLTLPLLLCISVLGSTVSARTMYPVYTMVEQIHITDYLDRLELVMLSVWLPLYVLKCCFLLTAILVGFNAFTGQHNQQLYAKQVGWFLQVTTALAFRSVVETFDYGNFGTLLIALGIQMPLYLVLLVLLMRHETDPAERKADQVLREQEQEDEKKYQEQQSSWFNSVRRKTWSRWTVGLLGICAAFLIAGGIMGKDWSIVGSICGFGYVGALLVMLVTTYMEMSKIRAAATKLKQSDQRKEAKESQSA